jgi:deoxyribonuclease I
MPSSSRCIALTLTLCVLVLILVSIPQLFAQNATIESFNKAKRLMEQVFAGHETTFYCGCTYTGNEVDVASCGYQAKNDPNRAKRLEWEHVVPAHAFGQSFREWREGHPECVDSKGRPFNGRNCARKMVKLFRYMEADLYNLQPAIGEVNGLRNNYSMEMIPGEQRDFGACDIEIENRKVEPRPEIRRGYRQNLHVYGAGISRPWHYFAEQSETVCSVGYIRPRGRLGARTSTQD